jgi:BASS family bile acid:Na+ symporter
MRNISFAVIGRNDEPTHVSLSMLMLAGLLFNAGLGVRAAQLSGLLRRPRVLIVGLMANLAIPVVFIFGVAQGMARWHNPDEVQDLLVGLALVAAMPIAGSSAAWSQNTNGDLALSLALVQVSTFLSPVTTPLALHSVGWLATGDYADHLHSLASSGAGGFLATGVLLPSLAGMSVRLMISERRLTSAKPLLHLLNSLNLLVLNYMNAAISLPQTVADHDLDFLAITLGSAVGLCVIAFASGWLIARLMRTSFDQRTSLVFGLGMNNNGAGLVLASLSLNGYPRILLPIIFYNLVQHLVASIVAHWLRRPDSDGRGEDARESKLVTCGESDGKRSGHCVSS